MGKAYVASFGFCCLGLSLIHIFKGRFILTSVKSGLMIIDQQRAHIRILYDKYIDQISRRQGISQRCV